jgi:CBS domain-containing protein
MPTIASTVFAPARLRNARAVDLMMSNPVSIRDTATIAQLVAMLIERGISGAPVINEAGRPVGVVSQADVLMHDRERYQHVFSQAATLPESDQAAPRSAGAEGIDGTLVQEIMTPIVFSVSLNAPAEEVIAELVRMKVHRVFVVDKDEALVGVISPLDVLRAMME